MPIRWACKLNAAAPANQHIAYIGLGSNIEPVVNLRRAVAALRARGDVLAVSSVWKSPAIGSAGLDFLNAAAKFATSLSAEELKSEVLRPIEKELGRVRGPDRFAPRTIDLDILIFDDEGLDAEIWVYAHLAMPLSEILADYRHAQTGEGLSEVAARLRAKQSLEHFPLTLSLS